jgi:hypothetical protein
MPPPSRNRKRVRKRPEKNQQSSSLADCIVSGCSGVPLGTEAGRSADSTLEARGMAIARSVEVSLA